MPAVTFFPSSDSLLLRWAQTFGTRLTAQSALFGVSVDQCLEFTAITTDYATSLTACDPAVRCRSAVTAKNAARTLLKTNAKLLANLVNGQANVTDAQKELLGLNVRAIPQPIPAPTTAPVISVMSVTGWTIRIRITDSSGKRGKPHGAIGANLFSHVGISPPNDVTDWKYESLIGRSEMDVQFSSTLPAGTKVWLSAFWFNGRKESGPTSAPVASNLLGSGLASSMAA